MESAGAPSNVNSERRRERTRKLRAILLFCLGILAVVTFAIVATDMAGRFAVVGVAIMIVLSSGVVGALLGFLFAIPRVLAKDEASVEIKRPDPATPDPAGPAAAELKHRLLASNTNLERVSDWLTTMLVGVGLSQLTSINSALTQFRLFLSTATFCGQDPCSVTLLPIIGPFLLIVGAVVGFLLCYIYTRIGLSELFHDLEQDLMLPQQQLGPAQAAAVTEAVASLDDRSENPAYKNLIAGSSPSIDDSLNVMGILLYRPRGYQDVIDLAGKLSGTAATKRAEYWFYLAAAFGQKYHDGLGSGAEALQGIRDNAIDCARRAVTIDPLYRSRLWDIAQPNNIDDDLADFRNDRDFRTIVGVATQ